MPNVPLFEGRCLDRRRSFRNDREGFGDRFLGRIVVVARRSNDCPSDPAVVVLNLMTTSTGSFAAWLESPPGGGPG
jgi:hypothetical protein